MTKRLSKQRRKRAFIATRTDDVQVTRVGRFHESAERKLKLSSVLRAGPVNKIVATGANLGRVDMIDRVENLRRCRHAQARAFRAVIAAAAEDNRNGVCHAL